MEDECPQCGAPLRDDGFCDVYCHEVPTYPPPRLLFSDGGLSIGVDRGSPRPPKVVKLYQFMQEWHERSISEHEISSMVIAVLGREGMLRAHDADSDIEILNGLILDLLEGTEEVTLLEVEPTAWDRVAEQSPASFVRVGAGRWFAAGDLIRTGVPLLATLLLSASALSLGALGFKEASKGWSFCRTLVRALVSLPVGSVEREIFESLYQLSQKAVVVDFTALDNKDYERAFGCRPPTAREIAQAVGREEVKVLRVLNGLQSKKVVHYDRPREAWSIRF